MNIFKRLANLVSPSREEDDVVAPTAEQLNIFRLTAEAGDPEAQLVLGRCYQGGQGVTQDYAEALKWYRRAAKQGGVEALGRILHVGLRREGHDLVDSGEAMKVFLALTEQGNQGNEVAQESVRLFFPLLLNRLKFLASEPNREAAFSVGVLAALAGDDEEAARWYLKAATQGHATAQLTVGQMYASGAGVQQDDSAAVRWVRAAAEQGLPDAQCALSSSYMVGRGVRQDEAEAVRWLQQAAGQGWADAQHGLGILHAGGVGVEKDYFKALEWLRKAALQGHRESQKTLADWYQQAVDKGLASAEMMRQLGEMYRTGIGVDRNLATAASLYRQAGEKGDAEAQLMLGRALFSGEGVTANTREAIDWLRMAAKSGNPSAQYFLGGAFAAGEGIEQNISEAENWFRVAAEQGDCAAQYYLGGLFAAGQGVLQDHVEAYLWMSLACAGASGSDATEYARGRDEVGSKMTPSQIEEANGRARAWSPKTWQQLQAPSD